jgi:hypothetical protein
MSISTPSKPKISIAPNKWKIWRIINSATILLAYFLPWAVMEGPHNDLKHDLIFTGFQMLDWYRRLGLSFAHDLELPSDLRIRAATYLLFNCFLGLLTILIYCALNMIVAAFIVKLTDKLVWKILAFCLLALGVMSLWYIPLLKLTDLRGLGSALWGYWLVLIVLVSSLILEISYFLSKRT